MLPVISEVFKTAFDDGLKKLVQPAGLVPGAILVLLNVVAVYPVLFAHNQRVVTAFDNLADPWKLVIATAIVLLVGFVILNLSASILRAMTGELWRESPLFDALRDMHKSHRDKLQANAETLPQGSSGQVNALYDLHTRYPEGDEFLMPTRLGNAMSAAALALWTSYGIDLGATWAQMRDRMQADDGQSKALSAIDDQKLNLDTLCNLAFVFFAVAIEAMLISIWLRDISLIPWVVGGLAIGYITYSTSITTAVAWGDQVQAAFDLYRGSLCDALGLPKDATSKAERQRWTDASRALLWDTPNDDLFTPATDAKPKPNATANLSVVDLSPDVATPRIVSRNPRIQRWVVGYRLLVTPVIHKHLPTSISHVDGYIELSDSRLPEAAPASASVPIPPPTGIVVDMVRPAAPQDPQSFRVWAITNLGLAQSVLLTYEITHELSLECAVPGAHRHAATLEVVQGGDSLEAPSNYEFHITSYASTPGTTTLTLRDSRRRSGDSLRGMWSGQGIVQHLGPVPANLGSYVFAVQTADPGSYTLSLRLP